MDTGNDLNTGSNTDPDTGNDMGVPAVGAGRRPARERLRGRRPTRMSDQPDRTAAGRRRDRRDRRDRRGGRLASRTPSPLTVGVDIGGTKVAGGVVDRDGKVRDRVIRETPSRSPAAVEDTIAEIVTQLASRHDVRAVGIGAAGFVDAARERVLFAPHLAWRHEPLRDAVGRRVRLPVIVENDANAAAWAEWRFGSGRDEDHLICLTLGTGIGGGVVVQGALQRGRYGMAGEFGHMQVVASGRRCECGNRGCWEQYSSGNALVREARELAASGSPVAHRLLDLAGGEPGAITGRLVSQAAMAGDPAAIELFAEIGEWLGVGIANLAAAYDPGTVVVGGGVSDAGELLLAPARQAFRRALTGRGFRPEAAIRLAELGPEAGLVGAADLARATVRRRRYRRYTARNRHGSDGPSPTVLPGGHADGAVEADRLAVEHRVLDDVCHEGCVLGRVTEP
jgi:glucokinase